MTSHRSLRRIAPLLVLAIASCGSDESPSATSSSSPSTIATTQVPATDVVVVESLHVEIRETVPHDPAAYTQGLLFDAQGRLFESTGLEGESTLREIDPATGDVLRSVDLDPSLFGEGLALVGDRLVQITWQDEQALVYDVETFAEVESFEYEGEGWGLCHDGSRLVMSDGSDQLTFRDPVTFEEIGTLGVTLKGVPVPDLNELECVEGTVYANIWPTDRIMRIDLASGAVDAVIDASSLARPADADVLNGIAVDAEGGIWLTGKRWDAMYRVELVRS